MINGHYLEQPEQISQRTLRLPQTDGLVQETEQGSSGVRRDNALCLSAFYERKQDRGIVGERSPICKHVQQDIGVGRPLQAPCIGPLLR